MAKSRPIILPPFGSHFVQDNPLDFLDVPPHGGFRGYVADPDGHAWEIAYNPAWPISPEGYVTFGV